MTDSLGALLRRLQQAQTRVLDVAHGLGLTRPQLSVLGAVVSRPGIDQRSVTAATFIDTSTVAAVIAKLAQLGLLTRSRDEADARREKLVARAGAIEIVYEASPRLVDGNDRLLGSLPVHERERFLGALRCIAYADRDEPPEIYRVPSPDGLRPPLTISWGLGRSLRGSLQRHTRLWGSRFGSLLTPVQYLALAALGSSSGLDQRGLGELVGLDKASLSEMLRRLQNRQMITRRTDPADGRRRLIDLTGAGLALMEQVSAALAEHEAAFLAPLPAQEQAAFVHALRRAAELAHQHDPSTVAAQYARRR